MLLGRILAACGDFAFANFATEKTINVPIAAKTPTMIPDLAFFVEAFLRFAMMFLS